MKKFIKGIAIVSALLMAMTAFTACGNNSSSSKSEESSASVSSETKEESKKEESGKDESKGEESKDKAHRQQRFGDRRRSRHQRERLNCGSDHYKGYRRKRSVFNDLHDCKECRRQSFRRFYLCKGQHICF